VSGHNEITVNGKVKGKGKAVPDRPRRFQEVKVPRFHKNGTGWW
jgi:hypothetical protein